MKRVIWAIQAGLFYLFTRLLALTPPQSINSVGRCLGQILYRLLPKRRAIAIDNIERALPFMTKHPAWNGMFQSAEQIGRQTFINLGTSIIEVCRLYHGKTDLLDKVEVRGREHLRQARAKKNGLIFVTAHCGNWELMPLAYTRLFDETAHSIARHQNNPYLHELVERMRMSYGSKVIYNRAAMKPILKVIKENGVIGMLTDQAAFAENGVLIDFLGRKAWANRGPAVIAHKTTVPLLPVFIHREADRHVMTIYPEYSLCGDRTETGVQRDIQELARYLEEFICAHPADWYWIHRRWKRAGESVS